MSLPWFLFHDRTTLQTIAWEVGYFSFSVVTQSNWILVSLFCPFLSHTWKVPHSSFLICCLNLKASKKPLPHLMVWAMDEELSAHSVLKTHDTQFLPSFLIKGWSALLECIKPNSFLRLSFLQKSTHRITTLIINKHSHLQQEMRCSSISHQIHLTLERLANQWKKLLPKERHGRRLHKSVLILSKIPFFLSPLLTHIFIVAITSLNHFKITILGLYVVWIQKPFNHSNFQMLPLCLGPWAQKSGAQNKYEK